MDVNGGDVGFSFLAESSSTTALADASCRLSRSLTATTWTELTAVEAEANLGDWTISAAGAEWTGRCIFDSDDLKNYIDFSDDSLTWTDFEDLAAAAAGSLDSSTAGTAGTGSVTIFDTDSTRCFAVRQVVTLLLLIAYFT